MDRNRRIPSGILGAALAWAALTAVGLGQDVPPSPLHIPAESAPGPQARADGSEAPAAAIPATAEAVATFEGEPVAGGEILLRGDGSTGENLSYRWVQTAGPAVELGDATRPALPVRLPASSEPLEFLLVVGNASHVQTARLMVPVRTGPPTVSETSATTPAGPRADAGDDQVGLVGHLITLNGIRSMPRGQLAYRWVQVGGPQVASQMQDGYIHAFVPREPGLHRFLLVVAADGAISEPDFVEVNVVPASQATAPAPTASPAMIPSAGTPSIEAVARSALLTIEGGPDRAAALAEAFEGVAGRIDLYASYGDVFREISLRLEAVVPADPNVRRAWIDRLFSPLTSRMIDRLRVEGLDLLRAEGQAQPLSSSQRLALADLYRQAARGFRSTAPTR